MRVGANKILHRFSSARHLDCFFPVLQVTVAFVGRSNFAENRIPPIASCDTSAFRGFRSKSARRHLEFLKAAGPLFFSCANIILSVRHLFDIDRVLNTHSNFDFGEDLFFFIIRGRSGFANSESELAIHLLTAVLEGNSKNNCRSGFEDQRL